MRTEKGYSARKLLKEYPNRNWSILHSRIARLHTVLATQLRSCLEKHRTSSRRFCGHQTALISIRSITEFGVYCRSVCTVLAFATSVTWRSGWSRNGSALVRKSSIGLSSSGAHVCGRVSVKEEDTSNINCSLDTLGIDSLGLGIGHWLWAWQLDADFSSVWNFSFSLRRLNNL